MSTKTILVALLAVILAACAPATGPLPLGETTLGVGESVSGEGVTITFSRLLSESRCPADAICVTSGFVEVMVSVNGVQHVLTLGDMDEGDTSTVDANGHTITLLDVQPYPLASDPADPADYEITIDISH
jgi:hypothetical protein